MANVIFLFCILSGASCEMHDAHITVYTPAAGGINCQGSCTVTASGRPVEIGVTVACGPNVPFGTEVYVESYGWFVCYDHGGAIDDDEVDIAVDIGGVLVNTVLPTIWVYERSHVAARSEATQSDRWQGRCVYPGSDDKCTQYSCVDSCCKARRRVSLVE